MLSVLSMVARSKIRVGVLILSVEADSLSPEALLDLTRDLCTAFDQESDVRATLAENRGKATESDQVASLCAGVLAEVERR